MAYQIEIDELIEVYANPIIHKVMRQRLNYQIDPYRKGNCLSEAEDIYQTAVLKLVTYFTGGGNSKKFQVSSFKFQGGQEKSEEREERDDSNSLTEDLCGYIATIAHNVCNDFLRNKYPLRCRLKACLHNLMRNRREFAVWMTEGKYLCGFTEWTGQNESPIAAMFFADSDYLMIKSDGRVSYPHFISEVFKQCEGPVELDKLVCLAAKHSGIDDYSFINSDTDIGSPATMKCYEDVEIRELLLRVWDYSDTLTDNQRKAFLYTSFDSRGESLLHRLVREKIVTLNHICSALDVTKKEMQFIWDRFPVDAASAAVILDTSPQMVAKWRHRAMRKLSPMFR